MKLAIYSTILFFLGCSQTESAYECYIKQFDKIQVTAIDSVKSIFLYLIEKQHPEKTKFIDRFRAHTQHIVDANTSPFKLSEFDSLRIRRVLVQYRESGFPEEFRNWASRDIYYDGLHFKAMRNCLGTTKIDSGFAEYLRYYDIMGDIGPGVPITYLAGKASESDLNNEMLQHIYLIESFIPMYLIRFEMAKP